MSRTRLLAAGALATGAISATAVAVPAVAASVQVLHVSANPSGMLRFSTTHLSAHPGTVEIVMTNPKSSGLTHGIVISGHGVFAQSSRNAGPGQTVSVTAKLTQKGTYQFSCPVSGHAMAGMKGTLTIS